ncbi:glucuronate isomerase [Psychrosphaera sp. B3R10]|uniref:glucuronate isomerase n=1 Tax=unclassified Psychrosphaera TaxID=2641570 RepID=UPI001C094EC7|nr:MULTISPECIES: glucuronate isomerase [unclassified Psychrosphaera]MBU2881042.1 glucuronate isomerase [Psychrosphaera sp. I2R16]MBU2989966.1 glucuronate isomerase [Psychrosphaera sp. B3R10]MDO6719143.1 glucuronate isomerase [Psychrosphaera sp. 1_MG-2023]
MASFLHPDRLFSSDVTQRQIAQRIYQQISGLPIISPHGHTDPAWFAENENFSNAAELLIVPDHYVFRMLYSQGISLSDLGVGLGPLSIDQAQRVWQTFADKYYLFRGTPSSMWLDYVFSDIFDLETPLSSANASHYFDHINAKLATEAYKPRALFDRFNIETLATTEQPLDQLKHHQKIQESSWQGNVITTFRPDNFTDPEHPTFANSMVELATMCNSELTTFNDYLDAIRQRRVHFKLRGATATDHSHPTAFTADLDEATKEHLFQKIKTLSFTPAEAELFRGQMITEMATMSIDDGLVMQLHHGCFRNHNRPLYEQFGTDKGADIPLQIEFVKALQPLLSKHGNNPNLTIILFTLDETTYSREIAPLAGHYPALKAGPAWWFHDSPEGMKRFKEQVIESAGFYNTVGFNDDTRAFMSIPARHDVARRIDCAALAKLVAEHRLREDEAIEVAIDLTYNLVKKAYRF